MQKTLLSLISLLLACSFTMAQDFEKDARHLYQKLKKRATERGFHKVLAFDGGTPTFTAQPGASYRIAFIFDNTKADTLRTILYEMSSDSSRIIVPAQVSLGPTDGIATGSILFFNAPANRTAPIPMRIDVFPMGKVYIYAK